MSGGSTTEYLATQPGSASNILGQIYQQIHANYQSLYSPLEDKLIGMAENPRFIANAQQQAGLDVTRLFQAGNAGLQKQFDTSGQTLTTNQQAALQRKRGEAQGLAMVDQMNRAGLQAYDQQTGIFTGAAPNPAAITRGINPAQGAG